MGLCFSDEYVVPGSLCHRPAFKCCDDDCGYNYRYPDEYCKFNRPEPKRCDNRCYGPPSTMVHCPSYNNPPYNPSY